MIWRLVVLCLAVWCLVAVVAAPWLGAAVAGRPMTHEERSQLAWGGLGFAMALFLLALLLIGT